MNGVSRGSSDAMRNGHGWHPHLLLDRSVLRPKQSTLHPLLKNDGTIVTQIVESVRRPARGLDAQNASFRGGTRLLTHSGTILEHREELL